jgi:hypothetical protein
MLQTLNANYEPIQQLRDNGYGSANFKVEKAVVKFIPTQWLHGMMAEEWQAREFPQKEVYFRADTLEPIAIHGRRYKPIQYPDMIDKTRDMLERCNLDATGIKETISVSPNSGMCLVDYLLPAKEYKTPDGDTGCIKVMALSSFNGVWSFILSLGFHQSACLNSQIFIKNPASIYKARHTNKLDIDKGVSVLGKTANVIEDEIELWHNLRDTFAPHQERLKIFAECAKYKGDLSEVWRLDASEIKNKTFNYLNKVYRDDYEPKMGQNMWAVYNSITDWSTHAPSTSRNKIALAQRRVDVASEVMLNNFIQLAA